MRDSQQPPAPRRILVVDDSRDTAESFALLLRELGHDAQFVTDSMLVPDLARKINPHLVLLDIAMPGVDGLALARILRRDFGRAMHIVAVSGDGGTEARKLSREAGCDAHVQKPVDIALLESILAQMGRE
jgi:CheY-like chemotaxis protein